jgi:NADPH:quinone reductase-like Zn-dependent oxidoreductase
VEEASDGSGPAVGTPVTTFGPGGGWAEYRTVSTAMLGAAPKDADLAGAQPIAVTRSPERFGAELRDLGAEVVIADPADHHDTVHTVIDTVGGPLLVRAFDRLDANGVLIALGHLATEEESFPLGALMATPDRNNRAIVSFHQFDGTPLPPDFTWLSEQLARGVLQPCIAWRRSWQHVEEAITALRDGTLHGKAVADVD